MNEEAEVQEDGGSTGIGILILGVFVVWVWGAICGAIFYHIFSK